MSGYSKDDSWYSIRQRVLERDNHRCQNCDQEQSTPGGLGLEVHHIKTRASGGEDHPHNLITLCNDCHNRLHRITEGEIRQPSALESVDNNSLKMPEKACGAEEPTNQFDEVHWQLITEMRKGRVTPSYLSEKTGHTGQTISNRLRELQLGGFVKRIHRGLYELDDDPGHTDDDPDTTEE